jgi:benzoyl-CoA reductase/2-hydroxyglutaryl-CoA dehydratase subunit BcrC/BadD/HgdB
MDKEAYTKIIKKLNEQLKIMPQEIFNGVRMVGTGLLSEPVELLDIFVDNNIAIVDDDFAQESRQFRVLTREVGNAVEKMAYRIVDQKGCTFLYEEQKTKGEMLIDMVKRNNAQAVFVCMMKFCDPEEFDYPIIKEELEKAGIPILYIETDMQLESYEQVRTRIQSFSEMLI